MSFSRWYPVSSFYYDPSIQPTKPIANLQAQDESNMRKIPKGRYDTTYRREYLNFANGYPSQGTSGQLDSYLVNKPPPPTSGYQVQQSQALEKYRKTPQAGANGYQVLPPIQPPPVSIDHIVNDPHIPFYQNSPRGIAPPPDSDSLLTSPQQITQQSQSELPIQPIYLNPLEEQNLINDVSKELRDCPSENLKSFYNEMTSYDPTLSGYIHSAYVNLCAVRNSVTISEPVLKFVMSRYVSSDKERGYVNYEAMVKFLARCLSSRAQSPGPMSSPRQQQQQFLGYDSSGQDRFDPDEQAILRLMHENMRDWDSVNLIDVDTLRKKFYEVDPYNRYILTMREFEDVLYKNRIPIQRSLIFRILEKFCKVASGQYRWPAFVDFLERATALRMNSKKQLNYVMREGEKNSTMTYPLNYRTKELDGLKNKASEEERMEDINRQIFNLQRAKIESKQKIDNQPLAGGNFVQGESWFNRFMRLATAMYSHRVNTGIEFVLPRDEAKRLISAYNTVYELQIPEQNIDDGLNRSTRKGNIVIDDLLKNLSKVN